MKHIIFLENCSFGLKNNIRNQLYKRFSNDFHVYVFFLSSYEKKFINDINFKNVSIKKLNFFNFSYFLIKLLSSKAFLTFTIRPLLFGFFLKLFFPRLSFYPTITGTGPLLDSKHIIYKMMRLIYPLILLKAEHVFFHNITDAKTFSHLIEPDKFTIVGGSGIELPKTPIKTDTYEFPLKTPRIACFSRLLVDKGILHYLEATKLLLNDYPFMKGKIFLAGMFYNSNLKSNLVTKSQIQDWVKFGGVYLGQPANKADFYSSIDILCVPSFREGLSNVLLEGVLYQCLLLTTSAPGCIDVAESNSGIICEPRSTESLYNGLINAIKLSPVQQKTLRVNAYNRAKRKFSKDKVLNTYYEKIAK